MKLFDLFVPKLRVVYILIRFSTYAAEMPQCLPASSNPVSATDSPINMIVGATVKGPINRRRMLTIPLAPIIISKMAATMILPTSWDISKWYRRGPGTSAITELSLTVTLRKQAYSNILKILLPKQ